MGDFSGSTTTSASASALFDFLSDVANLPRYFARMTSAVPGDGEEVKTTAKMPDGQEVSGDAWFRVDNDEQHLEWGSEGPSNYSGSLDVRAEGEGSTVALTLHTTRVPDGDAKVQQGIDETLAAVKQLVEQQS